MTLIFTAAFSFCPSERPIGSKWYNLSYPKTWAFRLDLFITHTFTQMFHFSIHLKTTEKWATVLSVIKMCPGWCELTHIYVCVCVSWPPSSQVLYCFSCCELERYATAQPGLLALAFFLALSLSSEKFDNTDINIFTKLVQQDPIRWNSISFFSLQILGIIK